mmetsp:Transcript_54355/g.94517  ORF Transcript_54355/g.94517 Transcript_54355/m.94517 type:complete len:125 (+) Transcript_54355:2-376(+)
MLLEESIQQIFFDDNVEHENPRIVDCRHPDGTPVPQAQSMNKFMSKVNPVEAVMDEEYFVKQLRRCHGDCGTVLPPAQVEDKAVGFARNDFVTSIFRLIRSGLFAVLNSSRMGMSRAVRLFQGR